MVVHKSKSEIVFDVINTVLMILLFIVMVYPFLYVFNCSISEKATGLLLLPKGIRLDAYKVLLKDSSIARGFLISVSRSLVGSFLMVFISGMCAYVLATPDLIFGKFFNLVFIITMYVSAGVVPTYIWMKQYGLLNSFLVYILPNLLIPFNMILIRNYIQSIPRSLVEAVHLDGGNDLQAYWYVIMPVCKPINAAILLFGIISQWNTYIDTQLYCAMDKDLYTLQYVLFNTLNSMTNVESLKSGLATVGAQPVKMAITIITVIPVMFVYPVLQKHFVSGIMVGSVKA